MVTVKNRLSCSVLICTRNRPDDLNIFLASLKTQKTLPNELVIIDSSDQPLNQMHSFNTQCHELQYCNVAVIYAHTRPGLTYQRNQAVSRATGKILYFFDDDVILDPHYITEMQT